MTTVYEEFAVLSTYIEPNGPRLHCFGPLLFKGGEAIEYDHAWCGNNEQVK